MTFFFLLLLILLILFLILIGNDDTPLAPDLQLDWSSSSDSDDEDGSVEVLGTVNRNTKVYTYFFNKSNIEKHIHTQYVHIYNTYLYSFKKYLQFNLSQIFYFQKSNIVKC